MGHVDDGLSIYGQDPVTHLQPPTSIRGASLNDAADFMGHSLRWTITSKTEQTKH